MKPKDIFMRSMKRETVPRPATGSATSIVTVDLMKEVGVYFPEAHTNPEKMTELAAAGHTVIGFDNVMPLFSVWHESAALGCEVNWGEADRMPDSHGAIYGIDDDIVIPGDLLTSDFCQVPLQSLSMLQKRFDEEVAVIGKVFGPWTLGYHMFGVEEFLINTILKPDAVKRAMERLKEVTIAFGTAQVEAGADALCYADHATRDLCSPDAYRDFLLELHEEMNDKLPCPLILHICGDTSDRLNYISETGIDCFHYDSKVPDATARELGGDRLSLMGGTSNFSIIRKGSAQDIIEDVRVKHANSIDIIGPECAVPLDAPYKNMKILTDEVKKLAMG